MGQGGGRGAVRAEAGLSRFREKGVTRTKKRGPLADETPGAWDAPAKARRIATTMAPVGRRLGGAEPREGLEPSAMTVRSRP